MELGARKLKILQAVIEAYIQTGEPVGSKALCELLDVSVSSATIRNEMASLSELGLLEQPHTSAGRIPTQFGYRLYINELMKPKPLSDEEMPVYRRVSVGIRRRSGFASGKGRRNAGGNDQIRRHLHHAHQPGRHHPADPAGADRPPHRHAGADHFHGGGKKQAVPDELPFEFRYPADVLQRAQRKDGQRASAERHAGLYQIHRLFHRGAFPDDGARCLWPWARRAGRF